MTLLLILLAGCIPSSGPTPTPSPTPAAPAVPAAPLLDGAAPIAPEIVEAQTWGMRPDSSLERRAKANQIPQLSDRWALYGSLKDGPLASVEGGVLVCDLRLPGSPWWKSRPDMQAILEIGGGKAYLVGENNRDATVVTAPLRELKTGDAIKLGVEDRDLLTKNDWIDGGDTTFPGAFPLLIAGTGGKLHATCRLLRPDVVATRLKDAAKQAEKALIAFEGARGVDLTAMDLGYPWNEHQSAESGLDGVAALVGWSDPAVEPRRRRLAKAKSDELRTLADAVKSQVARATPVGRPARRPDEGNLIVVALHCGDAARSKLGDAAPPCVLEIGGEGSGVDLVWPNGRTEALSPVEGHPTLLAADHFHGTSHPRKAVLVRVTDGKGVQFWRVP